MHSRLGASVLHCPRVARFCYRRLDIAVVLLQQVVNDLPLILQLKLRSLRHRLPDIQRKLNLLVIVQHLISTLALPSIQCDTSKHESADLQGPQHDALAELLIKYLVLFLQVHHTLPVPLLGHEFLVLDIARYVGLVDCGEFDDVAVVGGQESADFVRREQLDSGVLAVLQVVDSQQQAGVIPGLDRELDIIDAGLLLPLQSALGQLRLLVGNTRTGAD